MIPNQKKSEVYGKFHAVLIFVPVFHHRPFLYLITTNHYGWLITISYWDNSLSRFIATDLWHFLQHSVHKTSLRRMRNSIFCESICLGVIILVRSRLRRGMNTEKNSFSHTWNMDAECSAQSSLKRQNRLQLTMCPRGFMQVLFTYIAVLQSTNSNLLHQIFSSRTEELQSVKRSLINEQITTFCQKRHIAHL